MELLNHLKHPHPLVLSEELFDSRSGGEFEFDFHDDEYVPAGDFNCKVCLDFVSGLCYCCKECAFVVHKWCAELPLELTNHQLHPDHSRLVIVSVKVKNGKNANCDNCKLDIDVPYAFGCEECSLFLHPECALLPKTIKFKFNDANSYPDENSSYDTQLFPDGTLLAFKKRPRRELFYRVCKLCKQKLGTSFFRIMLGNRGDSFHIHCAMLPKTVKHEKHLHHLTLHVPIKKEKYYTGCYCDLCEEERDLNQWLYYCGRCEVKGHLSCGLLGSPPPSKGIFTSNPIYTVEREPIPPLISFLREMFSGEDNLAHSLADNQPLGELVHFSHEHPLFLFENVWDKLGCTICDMHVYGKSYCCVECGFVLHKWCAELPQEVHFGLHFEHPLTLMVTAEVECSFCRSHDDDFTYCCLECNFSIHTTCVFLSKFGLHKSHQFHDHPLQVINFTIFKIPTKFDGMFPRRSEQAPPCNACQYPCEGVSLGCDDCGFYLHVGCSLYPFTGKAETHRHNLQLNNAYQEDLRYTEHICDACEKPRTPNRWVYYCPNPKCYIVAHLDCGVPNLFSASYPNHTIEHQDDCAGCRCDTCDKDRDPNDWVYYCPSSSFNILYGPKLAQPIQRIPKSDPVYASLKEKVLGSMLSSVEEL